MTGTQVFDRLANTGGPTNCDPYQAEDLQGLAKAMVATAITSGKMLREIRTRMFPGDDSPSAMEIAKALQSEFQQWAEEADAAYERGLTLRRTGASIPELEELGDLIGRTRAMLQITPEDHIKSLKNPGRTWSKEEVRRELGLPPKR